MEGGAAAQRLTPRRKGGRWSDLNKERCRRLERLGRLTDAGRAALPGMTESGFIMDPEILAALQYDPAAWERFRQFPPLYQRARIGTIQIKKGQSRLRKLLENTRGRQNARGME